MSLPECRNPRCTHQAGLSDEPGYRRRSFCTPECEVRYDHIRDDARDAERSVIETAEPVGSYF